MKKRLIIYGGANDIKLDGEIPQYIYKINTGNILGEKNISVNNTSKFVSLAKDLRDNYTDYIYSLNKLFLENNIIYNNEISLFFFTEVSNKRTEIFDTYQTICHITIIKDFLSKEKNVKEIILKNIPQPFVQCVRDTFDKRYLIKGDIINKNSNTFLKILIRQFLFFNKALLYLLILRVLRFKSTSPNKIKNLFLTRYPKHFLANGTDSKYGNYFQSNDNYLISILADGIHQNINFVDFLKLIKEVKTLPSNLILLDNYLTFNQIIKTFFFSLNLYFRFRPIFNSTFSFNKINITEYLQLEFYFSLIRIPRLVFYDIAIKKIARLYNINRFVYYLFEFSYGRYFNYLFKKYLPEVITMGFQHGPNSMRHIMFFLAEKEPSIDNRFSTKHLLIPDEVLAENSYSKKVYQEGNYRNIKVMPRIFRLAYLEKINRKKIEQNTILVAAAMHDGEQLFLHLSNEMNNNNNNIYYFKFHPRGRDVMYLMKANNSKNIFIANKDLNYYLSFVSKVIVTQSSVGYEAYTLDIPVRVVSLPNKINDSPLLDISESSNSNLIEIDYMN